MTLRHRTVRRAAAAALLAFLALPVLVGCFNPFDPRVRGFGVQEPAPVPDSPGNALRLLQWCYENRAIAEYHELFDADYRFVFGQLDPDGNAYRKVPWNREDEIQSTTHLFEGGDANQPAATSIVINLDRNFNVTDDPNHPGAGHRLIRTSVTLRVTAAGDEKEVTGHANFFLVRGDTATIPEELALRGFGPDPNRWYILRHEDDTFQEDTAPSGRSGTDPGVEGARVATPTLLSGVERVSWGLLKFSYR